MKGAPCQPGFGAAPVAGTLGRIGFDRLDRDPGRELDPAIDNHALAGLQAVRDDPAIVHQLAHRDRSELRLRFGVHDPDEVALRALHDRTLRYLECADPRGAFEQHADKLAGPQCAVLVRQFRADQERAGLLAVGRIAECHVTRRGYGRAVGQDDFHPVLAVGRAAQLFLGDEPRESQLLVLGHAEVDTHRVECRYVREQAVRSRRNEAARLLARKARDTGERRTDRRVAQVDLGLLYPGACALDGSDGRIARALGVVEVLLAQRILRGQRAHALEVGGGRGETRLLRLELGASCRQRRLERLPVHLEEHGAFLHDAAFVVGDRLEETLDSRTDLDLLRALGFPYEFSDVWYVGRGHGHHDRGHGLRLRRRGRLFAAAAGEHDRTEGDCQESRESWGHSSLFRCGR